MRGRLLFAVAALVVTASAGVAQPPQSTPPRLLPPALQAPALAPPETPLPYPEIKIPLDLGAVAATRVNGAWQVGSPGRVFKETGSDEAAAREVARVVRDLRATEWVRVGSPRPVVEYGLANGKPAKVVAVVPRQVVPLDLGSARVEQVRGVWCVRDDAGIVLNFGPNKPDADQALAVARKYGFNRVGMVGGPPAAPALTYFCVGPQGSDAPRPAANPVSVAAQEDALTRTGVPVPGLGYVGERLRIDPRKVEARRDGAEWVVAHGPDVLARFGPGEWNARDAARAIQDGHFTEFCKVGSAGLTFFLVNGRAPVRVSLANLSRTFDLKTLTVRESGSRWAVAEPTPGGGFRTVFDVAGPDEGEVLIRLVRHYKFDQVCRAGGGGLTFLARSGR